MDAHTPKDQRKQSFIGELSSLWPGLPYLGLGVWLAWVLLSYSGTVWLSDAEIDGRNISSMYLWSTGVSAAVLLAAPFFRPQVERLLARRGFVYLAAAVASLGAACIVAAGPYYLATASLFTAGTILTGIGSAFLALQCGRLYGRLAPGKAIIYVMLSQLLIAIIFFTVLGGDKWFSPVPGGPSLAGIVAFVGLPLLASALIALVPSGLQKPSEAIQDKGHGDSLDAPGPSGDRSNITMLPGSFWKFCITVLFFTIATSMVRGLSINVGVPNNILMESSLLMFYRIAFAIVSLYLILRVFKEVNFGKLYFLLMVGVSVAVTMYSSLQLYGSVFNIFVGFASDMFSVVLWCLLALIANQKDIASVTVFGFGFGASMAGNVLGWMLGAWVVPGVASSFWDSFIFILLALLVLICAVLVFSEKDFDRLFSSIPEAELILKDLAPAYGSAGWQELDAQGGGQADRPRPYIDACKRVGKRAGLSTREQDVFELLALGRGNEGIAERLSISLNTARTHTQNIYAKLEVHSRHELIALVEAESKKGQSPSRT